MRALAFVLASLSLLSACGTLEIGSYGDGEGGVTAAGGSGPALDGGGGAAGDSPSAGSSGSGVGGVGIGGTAGAGKGGAGGDSGASNGGGSGAAGADGGGFASVDIGETLEPGSTVVDGGTYGLEGSGADVEGTQDGFRFLYRSLNGDGQIVARIEDVAPSNPWTKVGVMIRDELTPSAKNAFMFLRPAEGSAFQYRPADGAATVSSWQEEPADFTPEHNVRYLRPPKWLKLTREGTVFSAYSSDDGKCWWRRWTQEVGFDDEGAFFGVALSAGGYGSRVGAVVTNVELESAIEPHNARCERTQIDGDLPLPPEEQWIVPPGRFGNATWDFTIENPNGSLPAWKCDPNVEESAPYAIASRTDGPDHPNCPNRDFSPAWTQLGFEPDGWMLEQPVGIGYSATQAGDTRSTYVNSRGIWLRKVFSLSSQTQKDELMLWGRWSDGITVYVNGVLATWNGSGTSEYKYLGLSTAARAALVVGESNVIAVRLEWDRPFWNGSEVAIGDAWDRFFDLGLTTSERLASLPLTRSFEPNVAVAGFVDTLKEYLQQQGVSGATFAISKDGAIVSSAGFGWRDKALTLPMPSDARLRLAGNEDVITNAAIVKLIEDGVVASSTPVFALLGLEPVPGRAPGANVELITVEQLRTHTSGIGGIWQDQRALDEMAFAFGISPVQWTASHRARWLYSLGATDVGAAVRYSPDGYFLLRYLIEKLIAPRTLEDYLNEDLGLSGGVVSHERLTGRESNEGYITREPTWDRWLALESSLALSAPATGFASFFTNFALGYSFESENTYARGGGGVSIAGIPGTWSMAFVEPERGLSLALLSNNHGTFDELIPLLHRLIYEGSPCTFGQAEPRLRLDRYAFIDNVAEPEHYINVEGGLGASPVLAGWWSAQWRLEAVEDSFSHYSIKNRWTDEYLHMDAGLLSLGATDPSSWSAQWLLVYVGGVFYLQNREENTYLSLENGVLVTRSDAQGSSALWRFCN